MDRPDHRIPSAAASPVPGYAVLAVARLFGALALVGLGGPQVLAEPVPLRCRIGDGPWQSCSMQVERPGERWAIQVAGRQIAFRHDGSGIVTMHDPSTSSPAAPGADRTWVPVETTWIAGPALCWNGVCAQGDIPLD